MLIFFVEVSSVIGQLISPTLALKLFTDKHAMPRANALISKLTKKAPVDTSRLMSSIQYLSYVIKNDDELTKKPMYIYMLKNIRNIFIPNFKIDTLD
jgi:hypothetical protein